MQQVLSIQGLYKSYGKLKAVQDLNLTIPTGSIFGILGPNGSGKTTTLGIVLGVTRAQSGQFRWFDNCPLQEAKHRLGALLETPNFYPYLTARQNLELVAKIKGLKEPNIKEVLQLVKLWERAGHKFKTYSLGMKQRLAIASALLGNPEVLVLDEPTNGLDPQGIAEVRHLIQEIGHKGITVIIASHILAEVEKVCDHVAVLQKGSLLFEGTVKELSGSEGRVELQAADMAQLKQALLEFPHHLGLSEENGRLELLLSEGHEASEISRFLAEREIFLSHLHLKPQSLEEGFLKLVSS